VVPISSGISPGQNPGDVERGQHSDRAARLGLDYDQMSDAMLEHSSAASRSAIVGC
jgi:hypothetical protein